MPITLDPIDLNFINLDTENTRQAVASYCILSECPDFLRLKQRMSKALDLFPKLKHCFQPGKNPSWVPATSFNIDNHFQYIYDPSISSPEQLNLLATEIFTAGVDFSYPLWKFTLISNHHFNSTCNNPQAAMIFILHHALADGLGGLEILNVLTDSAAEASLSPEAKLAHSQKHQHRYFPSPQLTLINKIYSAFSVVPELCSYRPRSLLNGTNSQQRSILLFDFNLRDLKQAKKVLHCSLNHLFLTIISTAIHNFHKKLNYPVKSLRAIIPFNMRPTIARHDLGNHLTGVGMMLPTMTSSIVEQLKIIIENLNQINSSRRYGVYYLLGRLNALMPQKVQPYLCKYQANKTNLICTNVPGPQKTQFLAGAKITKNYCLPALMSGHGIGFSIFTYTNSAHLCLVYDRGIIKDPELLRLAVNEAKNALFKVGTIKE